METAIEQKTALTHIICVGGMSWGKSETPHEAFMNWFKHERPKGDMTVHFRLVNADAYVDDMGTLYATKESVKLPDVKLSKALIRKYQDVMEDLGELMYPVEEAMLDAEVGDAA